MRRRSAWALVEPGNCGRSCSEERPDETEDTEGTDETEDADGSDRTVTSTATLRPGTGLLRRTEDTEARTRPRTGSSPHASRDHLRENVVRKIAARVRSNAPTYTGATEGQAPGLWVGARSAPCESRGLTAQAAQRTPLQLQSRSIVAAPGRASRRLGFVRCKRLLCTPVRQQSESPSEALGKRLGRASWGTETSCILRFCRLPQVEARALTAHRRTDRFRQVSD